SGLQVLNLHRLPFARRLSLFDRAGHPAAACAVPGRRATRQACGPPPAESGAQLDIAGNHWQGEPMAPNRLDALRSLIRSFGSCRTAYSGGVASAFLAVVAHQGLGRSALAAIADSPSLPRAELAEAVDPAKRFGLPLEIVRTREFENASYLSNPQNRCYFCKHSLFEELVPLARSRGLAVIAYGENASDIGDHRPGARAAAEFQVRAPLKEVGMTKEEIR